MVDTIDVGHGRGILPAPAGASLLRMDAHARELGLGEYVPVTELGRTWDRQYYLWVNQNKPGFNGAWHPDDPRANHVIAEGRTGAADSDYQTGWPWEEHGWILTVPHEPWHREYIISRDKHLNTNTGDIEDMFIIRIPNGDCFMVIPATKRVRHIGSKTDLDAVKGALPYRNISDRALRVLATGMDIPGDPYKVFKRGADYRG